MNYCINLTTRCCVLLGDCKCGTKKSDLSSYECYSNMLADGKIEFGVSYTLKGLIRESNETY